MSCRGGIPQLRGLRLVVDSDLIDTPTLIGWLRPVILLPIAALALLIPRKRRPQEATVAAPEPLVPQAEAA